VNNRTPQDKIPQFDNLILGDFKLQTTSEGAVVVQPKEENLPEPSFIAKPVSIGIDISGIYLFDSAFIGGRIELKELLNKILDIPIYSYQGVEMPIRSIFGQLFTRLAAEEEATLDISNNKIPAVLNEVINNASLDEARALAQELKDAAQDASGALVELAAASAAASISGLEERLTAVEAGVSAVDLSGVTSRLDGAEAQIAQLIDQKLDLATYEGEKPMFATASDYSNLDARVQGAEMSINGNAERLDAIESALPTKVAQADYDVAVAHLTASVDSAQAAADIADSNAQQALTALEDKESKGLVSKLVVEEITTAGISFAYWGETIGATIADNMDQGKLVNYLFDAPASEITLPAGTPEAGAVRRLRNGNASGVLPVSLGGESYEIQAGETMVFQYNGTAWRLI
jgi:hypothetical protein